MVSQRLTVEDNAKGRKSISRKGTASILSEVDEIGCLPMEMLVSSWRLRMNMV